MGFVEKVIKKKDASNIKEIDVKSCLTIIKTPKITTSDNSFSSKLDMGVPKRGSSNTAKLSWLRSQIIGADVEFDSPFGKRKLTYADHTASGRCLKYSEDYILNNVLPSYGNSHTCDSYVGQQTTEKVHEASNYIKKCLGAGDKDAFMLCGSGTTSAIKKLQEVMGIAVPSILRDKIIECLESKNRWVVFLGPYEHHSNLLSWRQSLAEVIEIGLDQNGLIDIEALKTQLEFYEDSNRPRLGSFSACSNVTGIYSDTRKIARLLHQHGVFACFDFAASGPYVEIDMRTEEIDGYDAIFLSPHKFLGGPGSPGLLLISKSLYQLGSSPPSTCGGGTVDFVSGFHKLTLYVHEIEERENGGTPPIIQTIRAALAFWVKDYIGQHVIEQQEQMFIQKALERLLPNQNISVLGNTSVKRQAVLSILVYATTSTTSGHDEELGSKKSKPLSGNFVATLLNDLFGVQARGGCACAGPYGHALLGIDESQSIAISSAILKGYLGVKPGWTRVSFPYYMSTEEFEFILAAIEFIAIYGQRFLALYHFNIRNGTWTFKKMRYQELVGKGHKWSLPKKHSHTYKDENKHVRLLTPKYASYLKRAKDIADLLPKFPSKGYIIDHQDLDLGVLPFRV